MQCAIHDNSANLKIYKVNERDNHKNEQTDKYTHEQINIHNN